MFLGDVPELTVCVYVYVWAKLVSATLFIKNEIPVRQCLAAAMGKPYVILKRTFDD